MGNFEKLGVLVIIILVVVIMVLTIWGGPVPDGEPDPMADMDALSGESENGGTAMGLSARPERAPVESLPDFPPPDKRTEPEVVKADPEPAPEATPRKLEDLEHVVGKDDNLYRLSIHYYGEGRYYKEIQDANPGVNPNALRVGTKLRIPHPDRVLGEASPVAPPRRETASSPDVYVVEKGDSLAKISRKIYGSEGRWKAIWDANRDLLGNNPERLQPQMRLRLPR